MAVPRLLGLLTTWNWTTETTQAGNLSYFIIFWEILDCHSSCWSAISHTLPPALPVSLIRMQKPSLTAFSVSQLSCILTLLDESQTDVQTKAQVQPGNEQQHLYFMINLSFWQVQQKTIKPSGGKTMSDIQNRKNQMSERRFLGACNQLRFLL